MTLDPGSDPKMCFTGATAQVVQYKLCLCTVLYTQKKFRLFLIWVERSLCSSVVLIRFLSLAAGVQQTPGHPDRAL